MLHYFLIDSSFFSSRLYNVDTYNIVMSCIWQHNTNYIRTFSGRRQQHWETKLGLVWTGSASHQHNTRQVHVSGYCIRWPSGECTWPRSVVSPGHAGVSVLPALTPPSPPLLLGAISSKVTNPPSLPTLPPSTTPAKVHHTPWTSKSPKFQPHVSSLLSIFQPWLSIS